MTNKERASEICTKFFWKFWKIPTDLEKELFVEIDRALDEKDTWYKARIEENETVGAELIIAAFMKGQRDMRGRAALIGEQFEIENEVSAKIRALPIEGEK